MDKHTNALYCLVLMLTIWCTWNSAKSGNLVKGLSNLTTDVQLFEREVASLLDKAAEVEQIEVIEEAIKEEIELPDVPDVNE